MLSVDHLVIPILKLQSGSHICYIQEIQVKHWDHSILWWKWKQVKSECWEEVSYISPVTKYTAYLPFVQWHLMEICPLLKTAEWGAASDRKTRVGWRRKSCRLRSPWMNHIDGNVSNILNVSGPYLLFHGNQYSCSIHTVGLQFWETDSHSGH